MSFVEDAEEYSLRSLLCGSSEYINETLSGSKRVATLIKDTENRRLEYLKNLIIESGIEEPQASEKANFIYVYTLGLFERIYANPDILKDKQKIYDRLHKILNCIE